MSKIILTQGDILNILQNSNSVPLGTPIWNSDEEYNKLKAIVECAVAYTHPAELTKEEILKIADDPDLCNYDGSLRSCIDFARAILRKAQGD